MKRIIPIIICLLLLSTASSAQQKNGSLPDCIAYGLTNNLGLKLSELDVATQKINQEQARKARHPNLNAFISHNYNWGRSFDVFTNQPITQRVQSNNLQLSSNITLFNGFQLKNTIEQSGIDLEAASYDVDKARNDLMLSVGLSYIQILFNIENLKAAEETANSTKKQVDRTKKLVESGVLPASNLLDLEAQLATNELQVVTAENALLLSYLQLKQILQLNEDTAFEIVIPTLPDPDINAVLDNPNDIYGTAVALMPEVRSADIKAKSSQIGVEIAKGRYYPTLTLAGNVNTFYSSAQKTKIESITLDPVVEKIGFTETINGQALDVFSAIPQRTTG